MYTTRARYTSRESFSGSGNSTGGLINIRFSTPCYLEGVYSWRTGHSNIAGPAGSPLVKQRGRLDGFGLITPTKKGNFLDRLADRKRYIEDFQRASFPAETDAGGLSTNRVSTTDTGHLFSTLKVLRSPYRGTLNYYQSPSTRYIGDIWGSVASAVYNPGPYTFGFAQTTSPLVVAPTERQAVANRYFAATAPDKAGASVAVTLIELLRGDIPSLLKNFREMMAGYKTVRNYAGSDALNIMFGWTPLIQEYANVIKTGMALERVVYFETFRRKRQWDGPTYNASSSQTKSLNFLNTPFSGTNSFLNAGDQTFTGTGFGVSYLEDRRTVAVEDYHFASRYTGLAKAGRRANSFSDQAMDVVKRMGLVDDPRLLWDLTPYSWLVDWFTSMGDSISNAHVYAPVSGKYTSDYAYLTTQHTVSTEGDLLRRTSNLPAGTVGHQVTKSHSSSISVARWRARATPFGFGTQLGSLSASQFAILVALGFAKTR